MVIWVVIIEALVCFHNPPTVVSATDNDIDFLVTVLLNVPYEEIVVTASVEGHFPRVPETIGEDLATRAILVHKRIVCWNPILKTFTS